MSVNFRKLRESRAGRAGLVRRRSGRRAARARPHRLRRDRLFQRGAPPGRGSRGRRGAAAEVTTQQIIELAVAAALIVLGVLQYRKRAADGAQYGSQSAVLLFVAAALVLDARAGPARIPAVSVGARPVIASPSSSVPGWGKEAGARAAGCRARSGLDTPRFSPAPSPSPPAPRRRTAARSPRPRPASCSACGTASSSRSPGSSRCSSARSRSTPFPTTAAGTTSAISSASSCSESAPARARSSTATATSST